MAIFSIFLLGNIGQENVFCDILEQKNAFLGYKKQKYKTLKNGHFSNFFSFFINIRQENAFYLFLDRKNVFLGYKNKKFKTLKNARFFTGVNPWFRSKNGHFSNFFFQAIQARKMSFAIFQNEKTPFQAIKTRSSKSRKIDIFPKGLTHGFGAKMAIFSTFSFRQNSSGKCVLRYSRTKKRVSRL